MKNITYTMFTRSEKMIAGLLQIPATVIPGLGRFAIISDPIEAHIALWEATDFYQNLMV